MGGGRGIFSSHAFFFRPLPAQEFFFAGETLCTNFFFLDKYCFVCHLLIKKNYFTKELLYFVGFNNNLRPFFNNYIKDLQCKIKCHVLFVIF